MRRRFRGLARRLGRTTTISLVIAVGYAVALLVAGLLAPAYHSETVSTSGEVVTSWETFVAVNGVRGVVTLSVPLIVSLLVGFTLWKRPWHGALLAAWLLTGLLAALTLLAMLSIGVFVVPVTAALVVACSTSRAPDAPQNVESRPAVSG